MFEQRLIGLTLPADLLGTIAAVPPTIATIVQTLTYTNTFNILSGELLHNKFERKWKINVDGATTPFDVDASFKCEISPRHRKLLEENAKVKGLLTRPLTKIRLSTFVKDQDSGDYQSEAIAHYDVQVPDPSLLIEVPVSRAAFVKKISLPKFYKGLLLENYLNKPSQVEAALSIPINVLKAIFSIPAQLLSFKIAHVQQETALNAAKQNLKKSQRQPVKGNSPKAADLNNLNKASLDSQQAIFTTSQAVAATQQQLNSSNADLQALTQKINAIKKDSPDPAVMQELASIMPALQKVKGYQGIRYQPRPGINVYQR